MPDYQAMQDAHLQDPPSKPAHDEEQEETMSTNEKTAAEAGTSTTVQECSQNNSVSTLYMLKRSNGTADSFGTWSGEQMPTIC